MFRKMSQRPGKYETVEESIEMPLTEQDLTPVEEEKGFFTSNCTDDHAQDESNFNAGSTQTLCESDIEKTDRTLEPSQHQDTSNLKESHLTTGHLVTGSTETKQCSSFRNKDNLEDNVKSASAIKDAERKLPEKEKQQAQPRRKTSLGILRPVLSRANSLVKRRSFDPKILSASLENSEMQNEDVDTDSCGHKLIDSRLHEIRKEIDLEDAAQGTTAYVTRTDSDEKLQSGKAYDPSGPKRGKVASFFRKLSFGSMKDSNKSPNTRRSMPVLNAEQDAHFKRRFNSSIEEITKLERSNSVMNEKDLLIRERDKAVEEWTKATSKWEQLLDEVERLMSELNMAKMEKEDRGIELTEVITAYEEDLDSRDLDLELLREKYIDLNEQIHVVRKERLQTLSQYDDLLKKHYDLNKEFQEVKAERETLKGRLREAEQKVNSLRQQVDICKHDRDHALRLWNSSVEERKKLHQDMAIMIQGRDSAIRKAFTQAEEIIQIKDERDKLKHDLEIVVSKAEEDSQHGTSLPHSRNDSGYSADQEMSKSIASACEDSHPKGSVCFTEDDEKSEEDNLEVFAVFLDKTDSKFGIKVDNAVDDPRVYITHVSSNVASRNNIRKYDRIISVNGVTVVKADKKTVERLIRDCAGRLTLVLQRDKDLSDWNTKYRDVELRWGRQASESQLGLRCNLVVTDIREASNILGSSDVERGDMIHKINSQDISSIIASLLRKYAKKSGGKVTVRLRKKQSTREDPDRTPMIQARSPMYLKAPSVGSDGSSVSICSTSSGRTTTTFNDDCTSLSSVDAYEGDRSHKIREFGFSKKIKQLSNSLSLDVESSKGRSLVSRNLTLDRSISDLGRSSLNRSRPRALDRAKSETSKFEKEAESLYESLTSRFHELQSNQENSERRRRSYYANRSSLYGMPDKNGPDSWKRKSLNLAEFQAALENKTTNYSGDGIDFSTINPYSTLPRVRRVESVRKSDTKSSYRVLRLAKESQEDLGFRMQGGNRAGIYVTDVREGSVASKGGLLPGDKILHLNSYDLTKATMDYAMKVILSHATSRNFRIEVKQNPDYLKILEDAPLDSLYIRAHRSYEASNREEISFAAGDVLHVTNTLADFRPELKSWQWFATKIGKDNQPTSLKGYIPSLEMLADFEEPTNFSSDLESFKSDEDVQMHVTGGQKRSRRSDVKKWLLNRRPSLKRKRERERRQEILTEAPDPLCALYEILPDPPASEKLKDSVEKDGNSNVIPQSVKDS